MNGRELLAWLAGIPPEDRDGALERHLGLDAEDVSTTPPGQDLVGYHASGVASILDALALAEVGPEDVVVDLGSGLGKVTLLARLLTGATVRGIELQAPLVERARAIAARHGIDVTYVHGDARTADLRDATVLFLYLPFTGPVLSEVLAHIHDSAARRDVVVCSLGLDLGRHAPWLISRPIDSFWLSLYDSAVPGARARK